ncbi:MAG: hypothetical protein JSU91_00880 [Thermoplasmatales archaeon]|nr:MAG: hypothetical protein JSU91_00880 [Thermoplasmatales archaeon]
MVGVTTDRAELIEIQNIVKVFVVAERIIDLASEIKSELTNKNNLKSPREFNNHPNQYNKYLRRLTVRGFN